MEADCYYFCFARDFYRLLRARFLECVADDSDGECSHCYCVFRLCWLFQAEVVKQGEEMTFKSFCQMIDSWPPMMVHQSRVK